MTQWSIGRAPFNILRDGRVVAVCPGVDGSHDAETIVTACNQHEALVAQRDALLAALKLAESVYRQNCVATGEPSSVLDAMQAAIALTKGQS